MIVIGGGINGVAIAREVARGGRRVLLIERNDFASGTTSRATRIIHGGLRYLEHAELGLVRDSLRERERLLRMHPNLVRPMNFVLALAPGGRHSALEVRCGLWLYRKMAGVHTSASMRSDLFRLESQLDAGKRWTLFHYEDAQCEFPERLVAEWLMDAVEAGAIVRNHTEAVDFQKLDDHIRAVLCRDLLTGEESLVNASWVINATGPWADRVCAVAALETGCSMVGGVRGSHIVLPTFAGAPESAVYLQAQDDRQVFIIPWNKQILVGTTEVPDRGDPALAQPSAEEIDYLLAAFNSAFPRVPMTLDDIEYAFAGVRPLPYVEDEALSAITRRHILHDHAADGASGLISVIGGKLTTAASLARDCARVIGMRVSTPSIPMAAIGDASGVDSTFTQWAEVVAQIAGIDVSSARAIAAWHGRHAMCVAHQAQCCPSLATPITDGTEHIIAEAVYAARYEAAVTLGDILLRRVPIALSAGWDEHATREAAERIGRALHWTDSRIGMEAEEFEAERQAFLVQPAGKTRKLQPTLRSAPVAERPQRFA